ncbi:hypothetical protein LCGC14_0231530 [marine sediment metagenome]|uniref:Helicase ATP-binding domain-containing protein n=1 Tax=marine sediment metagenome TaxID=412755 RepID=A0A0F9UA20_9ZZZZ
MISEFAIKDFLDRELDDFDWIKKESSKELDKALAELPLAPNFHTKPFLHQKACFLIGVHFPSFLFLLDLGTGKTKIVLDLISYFQRAGKTGRALVLVPNIVTIDGWEEQIQIHAPHLKYVLFHGKSKKRWELLKQDFDICVLNYGGLVAMVTELRVPIKKKKGKRRERQFDWKLVSDFCRQFDAVVWDESDEVKNHLSLTHQICRILSRSCKIRFALTGTPMGRDPIDFWAQFYCIDHGDTLGKTLGMYRSAFFIEEESFWNPYGEWVFDERKKNKLHKFIKNRSIFYDESECSDLPKKSFQIIKVRLSTEAQKFHDNIKGDLEMVRGNFTMLDNAYTNMRTITSGFLGLREETDEPVGRKRKKVYVDFKQNPKIEALIQLVKELPTTSKMVVFHDFTHTGELIKKSLDKLGVGSVRLWGGTKDKGGTLKQFKTDPKITILVLNSQTGSKSLNIQVANYVVFFESPVSPRIRKQAEKRCHRTGQTKKVFFFDILGIGTIDFRIKAYLKEGRDLYKAIVSGKDVF